MTYSKTFTALCLAVGVLTGVAPAGSVAPLNAQQEAIRAEEAPPNAMWLDSLDLTKMVQRRQTPRAGQTLARARGRGRGAGAAPDASPIVLGGVTYPHGIGTLSINELIVDLKGQATRFVAMVGLDDVASAQGSVTVEAWVDNVNKFRSPVLKTGDAPMLVDIDLTGARFLELFIDDGGDVSTGDNADWGGGLIYLKPDATAQPESWTFPTEAAQPIASGDPASPRINAPRITGGTPGRWFMFKIPATGDEPLAFAASNLPAGLRLDSATGIITGAIARAGTTVVDVSVTNAHGRADSKLAIVGVPGSYQHEEIDAQTWADWGVDVLKHDWCSYSGIAADDSLAELQNYWRTTGDLTDRLTPNEQLTHISLWALQAAPLLIGADMSQFDQFTTDLMTNHEVMEISQDVLGRGAARLYQRERLELWARPLAGGTMAVGLFNRGLQAATMTATWDELGLTGSQLVRDVWAQKDLGSQTEAFTTRVPAHGVVMVKIGQPSSMLTVAGEPAELQIRAAGDGAVRVTLKPVSFAGDFPATPAVVDRPYPEPVINLRSLDRPMQARIGSLRVEVSPSPLSVTVTNAAGQLVQKLVFEPDGTLAFALDEQPVLGMGEGGPRPARGSNWREQPVQFDRSGALDTMEPRWQSDMYGSRNPVAMLLGTRGWGLFVATPWVQVDMTDAARGVFLPWKPTDADGTPQTQGNQQQALSKGLPPIDKIVPGLFDVFVFDAHDPAVAMKDFATITGPAAMPPKWALGYMQSHRTLEDDTQMLGIVDTFREKRIPLDAVIYLGTGFAPQGWNTLQPSFDFNPEVFTREPADVLADMHERNVKVVVHMVPWDRDKLPTINDDNIASYWQEHVPLVKAGIDAFWPDEGDWFNLFERLARFKLYYQGHLSTTPNQRPWSLQRNGFPGIAQWGGWVWSGDTETSWKTLEAQIAVGLNYSLSIGPYWGSDIGGFYPNNELTGELYARWFQFAAFSGSFRSHGRVWHTRLPWGWGLSDFGPLEFGNANTAPPPGDRRNILPSELNNPAIEPVARKYSELRYQLMPYTYTLAREARDLGLPLMRALWLHYPDDVRARGIGTEYLWGLDLLVAPVFTKGATTRDVYLPAGDWYDWWTNERVAGGRTVSRPVDLATMPIYVRAGAIIPFDPVRQYTGEPVTEPTTLRVYPGANGQFTLYDDDGSSQEYLANRGSWVQMTWNEQARTVTLEPGAPAGSTEVGSDRAFRITLPDGTSKDVVYRGARLVVQF